MERVHTRRTEDSFAAIARLGPGGPLAAVSGARTAPGRIGHVELAGEDGTLVGDYVLDQLSLVVGTTVRPIEVGPPVPTVREALGAFARALRAGEPMPISLDEGLRAVAVAEACYVSARTGSLATVEPIGA
jgi:predicted dehydrogenase